MLTQSRGSGSQNVVMHLVKTSSPHETSQKLQKGFSDIPMQGENTEMGTKQGTIPQLVRLCKIRFKINENKVHGMKSIVHF